MKRLLSLLAGLLLACHVSAAIEAYPFQNEAQEQQFRELTSALRCPKCQNNSIADSGSMIAADMRQKVYELMQQGQSREQIVAYMVARYGNFVTYDPPVTPGTILLWLLPALFVAGGVTVLVTRARRTRREPFALDEDEQERLRALLNEEGKRP
ncbi:cytochrome c-type biogenesis protein CcmH [Cronobacter sakazakii]|uniref:cytochrome c-type biogenesis protein n=1 Tax=Cronobacter sakazakii TaxID=28141 RepID=UPI000BEA8E45|nr:cytochrome c-type biogenesis protein [Cronobacter sakazakii]EJJ0548486.1 cytochrome c-type biogenesis protein CcmH [Cronobacter sakazakii]ELY4860423.1 cytochrome c-type biogenesis protein CcmH [Cronobacter sakazakii]ELY6082251.1 cytochrome c-type biogenesis protein CcmH [Cronobacter sakazakii]MBF4937486.1 cytochrome c-type biogenesis protein CcmH [Cronobacter sakazakii]MBK4112800.1 cytochrome c-type biogenesis protein CcmH [Cronobacter sakazakii]